jgi:hypothetical protein
MHKKSQVHVEMMLSFVIFLSAVLIILYLLNPLSEKRNKSYNINEVETALLKKISTDVGKLSIILNSTKKVCYDLDPKKYSDLNYTEVYDKIDTHDPNKPAKV